MCKMKINNLPVDVKVFSLFHKETLFQAVFFCDPLFSQTDFDHTHFGEFLSRVFCLGVCRGGFCPRVYVRGLSEEFMS